MAHPPSHDRVGRGESVKTVVAPARHARAAHHESRSTLTVDVLKPPVDAEGEWVPRDEFSGKKSFGAFQCSRRAGGCQEFWVSAHAQPKYTQACRSCGDKCFPAFLWQNKHKYTDKDDKEGIRDNNKPHLARLCEACRHGDCSAGRSKF